MNMFRNIVAVASLAFGLALWFVKLEDWTWVDIFGHDTILAIDFMLKMQPFSTIIFVVIATALFMTRKVY